MFKGKAIRPRSFTSYTALHGLVYKVKKLNQTVNNIGRLVDYVLPFWVRMEMPTLLFR